MNRYRVIVTATAVKEHQKLDNIPNGEQLYAHAARCLVLHTNESQ